MSAAALTTYSALKDDALARGLRPGARVRTSAGAEVLITSWPYFDEGERGPAHIMARTEPDNIMSNAEMDYSALEERIGEADL